MTCVKTGFHAYIIPRGEFAYGDAHEVGGAFFFRIVTLARTPISSVLHYEVNGYDSFWGADRDISTLVCEAFDVISYGYEGRPILEFDYIADIYNEEQNS